MNSLKVKQLSIISSSEIPLFVWVVARCPGYYKKREQS